MTIKAQTGPGAEALPEQSESVPLHISEVEDELGRAAALVGEIVDARMTGDFDTCHGNGDEDLLAAVEELKRAVKEWRS